jgi:hypothetical protein
MELREEVRSLATPLGRVHALMHGPTMAITCLAIGTLHGSVINTTTDATSVGQRG